MATAKKEIKVIYEDNEMLVVDKPAGWVATNENSQRYIHSPNSVENWVKDNYPNGLVREGVVHRLDKGTSGVLVVAKTLESLVELKNQFKQRKVVKHYLALVGGSLPVDGKINMPIGRSKYSFGKFKVSEEGKKAVTEFKLIKRISVEGKVFSLIDINLKTGRTHQIRVHMSYLGWPLAGDKIYGGLVIDGLERPFLHAYELKIEQPETKKVLIFKTDMPQDLNSFISKYGR